MKTPVPSSSPPLRISLVSLGCAKNLVDAEIMVGTLREQGVEITPDAATADAVILNTCSFIDAAQEESIDAILESAAAREARRPEQAVIVAGCLPQRFRTELPALLPEVDALMGIDQVREVGAIVRQAMARRAERLRSGEAAAGPGSPRRRARASSPAKDRHPIVARLAQLEARTQPEAAVAPGESPAGTPVSASRRALPAGGGATAPMLVEVHSRPTYIPDYATPRFRLTPRHFAYLKIAEGCNHPCSFCIIPRMRGRHRSRGQADVVEEARRLLVEGVKELNLISQDTTYYGLDLRPQATAAIASPARFQAATAALPASTPTLANLLRELNGLPGRFWIRLLYTHPAHWTDELMATLAECRHVARYVDIPLQHIHDLMLTRMRRETGRQYIVDLLARLRATVPGVALRTTFIVGFPGETEACFESLLGFIRETRFERLGVFTYSREDGTVAGRMARQIPDRVKQQRRAAAMALQQGIAQEMAARQVGRELDVLVEGPASERQLRQAQVFSWEHGQLRVEADGSGSLPGRSQYLVARGEADAPDIDGRVYLRGSLPIGEFARVRVVGATDYDLIAEPIEAVVARAGGVLRSKVRNVR